MRLAVAAHHELALQIEVDVARYHMIALQINLMNISAVTNFLARVVHVDLLVSRSIYMLSITDFDPNRTISEVVWCKELNSDWTDTMSTCGKLFFLFYNYNIALLYRFILMYRKNSNNYLERCILTYLQVLLLSTKCREFDRLRENCFVFLSVIPSSNASE